MYLVELRPGKEELYRTTDELAAAIRNGDVDVHSRIYHRATSKWISVTLHPQYKAIVAEHTPAAPPLPPLERSNWTFFNNAADSLAGADEPQSETKPGEGESSDPNHPWRRPLALSIMGGLLILGLQLAASGPKPPWAARASSPAAPSALPAAAPRPAPTAAPSQTIPTTRSSGPAPSPIISLVSAGASWTDAPRGYEASASESTVDGPGAAEGTEAAPRPAMPGLPAAPRLRPAALLGALSPKRTTPPTATDPHVDAVRSLIANYTAAHDSALARLESGMRVARLDRLFASERFSPAGGVTETRLSLAGVANFIRIYRQQQAAIEQEYQRSFATASKAQGWTAAEAKAWNGRPARSDSRMLASLTSSLVGQMDSLLGVLDAQAGAYALTRNTIRFEDPAAARDYTVLRERVLQTLDSAKAAGGADRPGPMNYLLEAIGSTRLPIAI
ncbi:MAG TPA: hypothetical protein VHR43_17175 [Gemmatimonadales bacterium]|nr:hypothetical protein [Gemmatimonadales bacterium]